MVSDFDYGNLCSVGVTERSDGGEHECEVDGGAEITLAEVMAEMPNDEFPMCAFQLHEQMLAFDRPLHVEGQCCVEVFCGCAAATMGVAFSKVPYIEPWDNAKDPSLNVIRNGHVLFSLS